MLKAQKICILGKGVHDNQNRVYQNTVKAAGQWKTLNEIYGDHLPSTIRNRQGLQETR